MICCGSCNNSCSYLHRGHKRKHKGAAKGKIVALGENKSLAFFRTIPRLFNLLIQVIKSKESVKYKLSALEVLLKLLKMDGLLAKLIGLKELPLPRTFPPPQKKKQQKQNVFMVCNLCF